MAGATLSGHQIDPGVRLTIPAGPIHPQPHRVEPLRPQRVGLEMGLTELLEPVALRSGRFRRIVELLQQLAERRRRGLYPGGSELEVD